MLNTFLSMSYSSFPYFIFHGTTFQNSLFSYRLLSICLRSFDFIKTHSFVFLFAFITCFMLFMSDYQRLNVIRIQCYSSFPLSITSPVYTNRTRFLHYNITICDSLLSTVRTVPLVFWNLYLSPINNRTTR